MSRIVFLNGDYLPAEQAKISIFDRAVNFGDAIYEVAGVLEGKLVDFEHHMQRYFSSLEKLEIKSPLEQEQILEAFRKLVELNRLDEGLVYMQVTRGEAERDFVWPEDIEPNVFMFTQAKASIENQAATDGIALASTADIRWARRDIKSVNLLAQVLAKKAAADAGAYEALMVDADGYVTECGSTSFFIVKGDLILTRPLSNDILPGVTRRAVVARIQALADDPRPRGCVKLTGADKYRVRQGAYRILYTVHDDRVVVSVVRVAHRKSVYRQVE